MSLRRTNSGGSEGISQRLMDALTLTDLRSSNGPEIVQHHTRSCHSRLEKFLLGYFDSVIVRTMLL